MAPKRSSLYYIDRHVCLGRHHSNRASFPEEPPKKLRNQSDFLNYQRYLKRQIKHLDI